MKIRVQVSDGGLIGIVEESGYGDHYFAFRGIPYAKPPIGDLRFRDPVQPEPWFSDRDASKHGNMAIQIGMVDKKIVGDEDCLFLNVYTNDLEPSEKRAVMVWIHGGGFFCGTGDGELYGPDYIIRKDVVLVTVNYRLGVLGFLNMKNKMATGNQGLKDVVMALQWIQKNISEFGGDSGNVTIFGESAGGAMVHYLAISPLTAGLFHKVISESGVAQNPWAFHKWTKKGFELAEKLGKVTSDPKVACEFLKTIDARKLIEVEKQLYTELERRQVVLHFTPSIDSESPNPFLPEHPFILAKRGVNVPFILGFNQNEGSFVLKGAMYGDVNEECMKQIDNDFKKVLHPKILSMLSQIPITIKELQSLYFDNKPITEETIMNYVDFISDEAFCRDIMKIADTQANLNNTTYLYYFSYSSKNSFFKKILDISLPGTIHTEELGYLFYPYVIQNMNLQLPAINSEDYKMVDCLTQMWTDFAKTGNPTPATNGIPIKWMPLKKGNTYDYLNIDNVLKMKTFQKGEQRWDWENVKKCIKNRY